MATQNQNTTSSPTGKRPTQNDSQIGGRTASTSTSTDRSSDRKTDRKADDFNKSDSDSRGTISPSTSDDVSSKSASDDSDDLDDAGMEYKAQYDTDVRTAPETVSPDWDKTQDPRLNDYGQSPKQTFNSDVKSDSKLDTNSQPSSPKKDNLHH